MLDCYTHLALPYLDEHFLRTRKRARYRAHNRSTVITTDPRVGLQALLCPLSYRPFLWITTILEVHSHLVGKQVISRIDHGTGVRGHHHLHLLTAVGHITGIGGRFFPTPDSIAIPSEGY